MLIWEGNPPRVTCQNGVDLTLAAKLELSERSLYELINQMKDLGAPIIFSKSRNSYVYTSQGKFDFGFREVI
jgi:hypothetical protein